MPELKVGAKAPDFTLEAGDGKRYALKDFRGKSVVLYFYPQDDTETCTKQACAFRDHSDRFTAAGAVILGISPDSPQSHAGFVRKFGLPFLLLADETKAVLRQYGVWKRKVMFGNRYMGVIRSTFVINQEGTIVKIFSNVRLKNHIDHVLEAVTA
jgi:peroxiredoxin Q/BCP